VASLFILKSINKISNERIFASSRVFTTGRTNAQTEVRHIVGISTVLVDQPLAGATISLPVITKSTIPALHRALAMEFLTDRIRANTISPSVVDTSMHANDDHEILKRRHPFPRLVQISEIVDALLYLQSASMVNGEKIRIDGGAHAGAKW
jgi:NAD(P)-dependent dehydrogenase (short-subunit alcohol dehydrogenase family)